jgi:hypothetical protein
VLCSQRAIRWGVLSRIGVGQKMRVFDPEAVTVFVNPGSGQFRPIYSGIKAISLFMF